MKPHSLINVILGIVLFVIGLFIVIRGGSIGGIIPMIIGPTLCYLGWRGGRAAQIVFGHVCIVAGFFLITWGIYLLPYSKPILAHIFARPLFWGMFAVMGGVCAIYHGFCRCYTERKR